jgi:hypothetical protein
MTKRTFMAVAWNNGSYHATGAGYGLKISVADRDAYLRREWGTIALHLRGGRHPQPVTIDIRNDSLWNNTCRELRSKHIGLWLIDTGLTPWSKGYPPQFLLTVRSERAFDVAEVKISN